MYKGSNCWILLSIKQARKCEQKGKSIRKKYGQFEVLTLGLIQKTW